MSQPKRIPGQSNAEYERSTRRLDPNADFSGTHSAGGGHGGGDPTQGLRLARWWFARRDAKRALARRSR